MMVRCTGELFIEAQTAGTPVDMNAMTNREYTGREPVRVEVPRPEGDWEWTHSVGNFARLVRGEEVRAWPVDQLLSLE